MLPGATSVLIAGGGPFGLMLALELGRRGIAVVLVDQDADTAVNPQAHATQARTMEHFRRLGFADEIRALGLPADFPTDIAYFTRFAKHELARIPLPSSAEARRMVRSLKGSWSAAELPHRCAQKFIEQVLRRRAEALPSVTVRYSMRLSAFRDAGDSVEAIVAALAVCVLAIVQWRELLHTLEGGKSFCAVNDVLNCAFVWESAFAKSIQRTPKR